MLKALSASQDVIKRYWQPLLGGYRGSLKHFMLQWLASLSFDVHWYVFEESVDSAIAYVMEAFKKILAYEGGNCQMLQTYKGMEFLNSTFQQMLKCHNTHFYTLENEDIKLVVVERFDRTLKSKMYCHFTFKNTWHYSPAVCNITLLWHNSKVFLQFWYPWMVHMKILVGVTLVPLGNLHNMQIKAAITYILSFDSNSVNILHNTIKMVFIPMFSGSVV